MVKSTVTLGGRPQPGPMQGIGGSKGLVQISPKAHLQINHSLIKHASRAEVLKYNTIYNNVYFSSLAIDELAAKGYDLSTLPALDDVPEEYIPYMGDAPLGSMENLMKYARFNLRNNMHDGDPTDTPLQFTYEAANCRLFYTVDDIYDITKTWFRIADAVWGTAPCVSGSSPNKDNTISRGACDTVPFSPAVMSTVVQEYQPGLLGYASSSTY